MNQYRKNFCDNVNKLRRNSFITQRELGNKLDVNYKNIGNYEESRSVAPYEVLVKYSEFFNVSIDDLIKKRL